jgi:hypothetical protein
MVTSCAYRSLFCVFVAEEAPVKVGRKLGEKKKTDSSTSTASKPKPSSSSKSSKSSK